MVSDKYSLPALAYDNLEIMLSAMLDAYAAAPRLALAGPETLARWDEAMTVVSDAARSAYRELVERPGFPEFFASATPVDELSWLNVGSRPSRRPDQGGSGQRSTGRSPASTTCAPSRGCSAGPRPGWWCPGWFGLGSGLRAAREAGFGPVLDEMRSGRSSPTCSVTSR